MSKDKQEIINIMNKYGFCNIKDVFINEIGLDFQVVFYVDELGTDWILRFPRRIDVYEKAKVEKEFLDLLNQTNISFRVPKFEICEKDLIAYKKVQGTPVLSTNEDMSLNWIFDISNIPLKYTNEFAKALVSLHRLADNRKFDFKIARHNAMDLRQIMIERIEFVKAKIDISNSLLDRWDKWLCEEEYWPLEVGLIHGDLYPGHLLVDNDNNLVGIIDWTEAKISDMAYDFLAHYKLFGKKALEDLIDAYKSNGGYCYDKFMEHVIEL
ncbi:macrolide 2'-phosphotransferase, partial [Acholeplasma sp. OttesenSCG-928-E16]|nr:macrolide 2'-phosphotransferase [Acholeplasma sp. OttesenSCG-928-E16]